MVLEGQKLDQLLIITITTSVPNFNIFLLTVHRAAIDFHWRKNEQIVILTITIANIAASSNTGPSPARRSKQTKHRASTSSTAVQQAFKHQEQCRAARTKTAQIEYTCK